MTKNKKSKEDQSQLDLLMEYFKVYPNKAPLKISPYPEIVGYHS